jgi:predicted aspartyl protease
LGKAGKELVAKGDAEPNECTNNAVLIGTVTLETLGLEADPATGRLKEAKTYLL